MDSARNGGNTLSWKVQSNTNDVMHSGESVDAIIQSKFHAIFFLGAVFPRCGAFFRCSFS